MADRFFATEPLTHGDCVLSGPEAHHLGAVRRFQIGDAVVLFNGDGHEYPAEIVSISKKQVLLSVLSCETPQRELPFPIVIASALPKSDRADFLIEKLVELGVSRFIPLITSRSVVQPKEAKTEKLERAVIEASKQCGRNILMQIDPPMKWERFLELELGEITRCILHTSPEIERSTFSPQQAGIIFAVGPEGGFRSEEVAAALERGWRTMSLGTRVLRVETAAIVAAALAANQQI